MPNKIAFTAAAERDLILIAAFSSERFGEAQASKYQKVMADAFRLLQQFPQIGVDVSDIKPDARRHVHASHAIYYRIKDGSVLVLRILGRGQDPTSEFAD